VVNAWFAFEFISLRAGEAREAISLSAAFPAQEIAALRKASGAASLTLLATTVFDVKI
jgi:hypothetical protein